MNGHEPELPGSMASWASSWLGHLPAARPIWHHCNGDQTIHAAQQTPCGPALPHLGDGPFPGQRPWVGHKQGGGVSGARPRGKAKGPWSLTSGIGVQSSPNCQEDEVSLCLSDLSLSASNFRLPGLPWKPLPCSPPGSVCTQ